jgi:muramidase (phage lysozyme)
MVSSVLSPEKIVGRQNTNKAATQNFISGGSVVGASVVNGAANKIVGFQRAGVQPAPSATGSIVSTISTNINNNVTNTINKTLQGFSSDYQRRLKQVDDAKPIGILGKFLNVYKTALGFINFFGNKKNIDKVRDSLEALKKSFTESFEVAKLIRQVIIKIVKQLSNLPVASPSGGGGLNLDVDIPGGPLRKTAPRGLQRMMGGGKGKMLALGAGALGLGALGAGTVNALSDSPQDQAQAAQTSPDIPGDVVDKFSSIVDRFANAVSKLFENKKPKQQQSSGSSGGGGGTKPSAAPGSSPSAGSMGASDVTADTKEEKSWLQTIRSVEGTADSGGYNKLVGGEVVPELSQMTLQEVYDLGMKSRIGEGVLPQRFGGRTVKFGADSHAMGAYQFKPQTMMGVAKQLGLDPKTTVFSPEIQDKLGLKNLRGTGVDPTKKADIQSLDKAQRQWAGLGPFYGQTGRTLQDSLSIYNQYYGKASASPSKAMGGPAVDASMISPEARKALGIQISQPPPSQQQQQPVVMPINLGGGGQQQTGGGSSGGGGGGSQGSGPSVPFLPTSNPDNFLVLYSRMVYNIVDG